MKFNSAAYVESKCLACGILCVKFAIGSKTKNRIKVEKLTAVNSNIDIKLVNAKYFFQMARQRDHKVYI